MTRDDILSIWQAGVTAVGGYRATDAALHARPLQAPD